MLGAQQKQLKYFKVITEIHVSVKLCIFLLVQSHKKNIFNVIENPARQETK